MKNIKLTFLVIFTCFSATNVNAMTKITKTKTVSVIKKTTYAFSSDEDNLSLEDKISTLNKCFDDICKEISDFYLKPKKNDLETDIKLNKKYTYLIKSMINTTKTLKKETDQARKLSKISQFAPLFFSQINFTKSIKDLESILKKLDIILHALSTVKSRFELEKSVIAYDSYFPRRLEFWTDINIKKWTTQQIAIIDFLKAIEDFSHADKYRTEVLKTLGEAIKIAVYDCAKAFSNNENTMKEVLQRYYDSLTIVLEVRTKYDKLKKDFFNI